MARRRNSRFRRSDDPYTSGSYMCRVCTERTRETGKGESGVAMCAACYDGKPGDEIAVSEGKMIEEAFVARHGEHSTAFAKANAAVTATRIDPYQYASHLASLNID